MGVPFQATRVGSQRRKYYDLFPSLLKDFFQESCQHKLPLGGHAQPAPVPLSWRRGPELSGLEVPHTPPRRQHLLPRPGLSSRPFKIKEGPGPACQASAQGKLTRVRGGPPRAGIQPAHWPDLRRSGPMGGGCARPAAGAAARRWEENPAFCLGGSSASAVGAGMIRAECMDWVWSCVPACTWGRGRDGPSELAHGPGSPTVPSPLSVGLASAPHGEVKTEGVSSDISSSKKGGWIPTLNFLRGSSSSFFPSWSHPSLGLTDGSGVSFPGRGGRRDTPGAVIAPSEVPLGSPARIPSRESMQSEGKALGARLSAEDVYGKGVSPTQAAAASERPLLSGPLERRRGCAPITGFCPSPGPG